MSNNLIFYNLPQNEDEICADVVINFCKDTLRPDNTEQIGVPDVHRIGNIGPKIRPILVKFVSPEHRASVCNGICKSSSSFIFLTGITDVGCIEIRRPICNFLFTSEI